MENVFGKENSFYEKNISWITKLLFWTIILAPYLVVLNDIYQNKLVYNNRFWIKRAKIYFLFILIMYSLMWLFSKFRIDYLPAINLISIYILIYLVLKLQINYKYLFQATEKDCEITKEELEKVKTIQNIDDNLDNKNNKIKSRILFGIVFFMIYIFIFNFLYQSHYIASILNLFLIAGYDYLEQKKFKRDRTELFWKKRVMFYLFVLSPILVVINFLIYSTLIFKY